MSSARGVVESASTHPTSGSGVTSGRSGSQLLRLVAWGLAATGLGAGALAVLLQPSQLLSVLGSVVPFCVVGLFIVSRRPRALVGWFLLIGGLTFGLDDAATQYVVHSFSGSGAPGAGGIVAGWLIEWIWIPAWSAVFIGIALVYPDGRLPSRRWRTVGVIAITLPAAQLIARALYPGPIGGLERLVGVTIDNPVGIAGAGPVLGVIDEAMATAFLPLAVAGVVALVVRYRRGGRTARLQLRWLMLVVVWFLSVFVLLQVLAAFVELPDVAVETLMAALLAGYPLSIAIAVTRYRLYEVDRIINRTVVYASVTAVLVALYVVFVVTFQALLRPVTSGGDLAVAASTLVVAAAFGPVRRRAQQAVDRRFDRSRYDAQRTVEGFAHRLRDAVDVRLLTTDVCGVVRSTLQPRSVDVWLAGRSPATASQL